MKLWNDGNVVKDNVGADKTPHPSISNVIWIMSSDTLFFSWTNYFQIMRRQCCPCRWALLQNIIRRELPKVDPWNLPKKSYHDLLRTSKNMPNVRSGPCALSLGSQKEKGNHESIAENQGGGNYKLNGNQMIIRLSNKKIFGLAFIHRSSISFASGSSSKAGPLVINNYMTLLRQ